MNLSNQKDLLALVGSATLNKHSKIFIGVLQPVQSSLVGIGDEATLPAASLLQGESLLGRGRMALPGAAITLAIDAAFHNACQGQNKGCPKFFAQGETPPPALQ